MRLNLMTWPKYTCTCRYTEHTHIKISCHKTYVHIQNRFTYKEYMNIYRTDAHYTEQMHNCIQSRCTYSEQMGRVKRIGYLLPMLAAKVQASLRIRAVSPEPPLLAHTSSESRGTFRQKARSLAPLNGWACAVKICHDGMLEDTNSLDGAQMNIYLLKFD